MIGIWFWLGLWVVASTVLSLFVGKWIKACKGPRLTWDDEAEHWRRAAERHQIDKECREIFKGNGVEPIPGFMDFDPTKAGNRNLAVSSLTAKEFVDAYGSAMAKDMVRYTQSPCGTFYVCAKCGLPIELDGPCYGCASVPSKPLEGDWQAKIKWPDLRHGEPLPFEGEGDSERARR